MPLAAVLRWLLVLGILLGPLFATRPAHAEELSFARALRLAHDRAAEMKIARASVALADAQITAARVPYIPSLIASGRGTLTASQAVTVFTPPPPPTINTVAYTEALIATGTLRWTVYDFGRTGNSVTSAEAVAVAASAGALDTEATLIDAVTAAYLGVVYGEKVCEIERSIIEQREKLMLVVKGLVKQALSPPVEELRTQSRIEATRRDLEQAEGDLGESRTVLLAILGLDPRSTPTLAAPKLPPVRLDALAAGKQAEEHKPSVVAAKATAEAQEAIVDSARSRYLPSLGVTGDANYTYSRVDTVEGWLPARSVAGGVVLTLPIYDPSNGAQLDVARAQAAEAEATYALQKRDARSDAARTVVRLAANEKVLDHARKAADSAAAVVAVIRVRYTQGLSNVVDLIEAETEDANARIAVVRAEQARDAAAVHLFVTTGRVPRLYEGP
jgi:outer membrane protein TolC